MVYVLLVVDSHKFGYGLMDCAKMVDIAESWKTAPPQLIKHMPKVSPDRWVFGYSHTQYM